MNGKLSAFCTLFLGSLVLGCGVGIGGHIVSRITMPHLYASQQPVVIEKRVEIEWPDYTPDPDARHEI